MADPISSPAAASPVPLTPVETALLAAIYAAGKRHRPNGYAIAAAALAAGEAEPRRCRAGTHGEVRAFVGAETGSGHPWIAARMATWREDAVLLCAQPQPTIETCAPRAVRVLRVRDGWIVGEDPQGSDGFRSVVRVVLGMGT